MSFEDNGDSLASEGLFTPFFASLHIFPLPLPRLLLSHDFPGIFYADFDVAVGVGAVILSFSLETTLYLPFFPLFFKF